MDFRALIFLLTALFLAYPAGAAENVRWPALKTDAEMLNFLGSIEPEVPGLVEGVLSYETDPYEVISRQAAVNEKLGALLGQRHDRTEIEIRIGKAPAPAGPSVDSAGLESLKFKLREELTKGGADETFTGARAAAAVKLPGPDSLSVEFFLNHLVKALPQEKQAAAFPLPPAEKLAFILGHASRAEMSTGLASAKAGIEPSEGEVRGLFGRLKARDEAVELLANVRLLLGADPGPGATRQNAHAAIDSLSEADLRRIAGDKKAAKGAGKKFAKLLLLSSNPSGAETTLRLVEKPPAIAMWSGMVASDSFSKNAAPYVNAPGERIWWAYDEKGAPLGYVLGEEAMAEGRKVLHLTTINGPRITPARAQAILDGFSQAAPSLGVEKIFLPPLDKLHGSFNYPAVRGLIERYVAGRPSAHLNYPDEIIRAKVGAFAAHPEYQSAEARAFGVEYSSPPITAEPVRVQVKTLPAFEMKLRPYPPGEAALLALQMKNLGKTSLSDRTLRASGLSQSDINKIYELVANEAGQNTGPYLETLSEGMKAFGVSVDPALKITKPQAFYEGLLRAPDAFSAKNAERSGSAFLALLHAEAGQESLAAAGKHGAAALRKNERLQAYVTNLVSFDDELGRGLPSIWERLQLLQRAGLSLDAFPEAQKHLRAIAHSGAYSNHDYYLKLGAAGALLNEPADFEKAVAELLSLKAVAKGADPEGNRLLDLAYHRHPATVHRLAAEGAQSTYALLSEGSKMAMPWFPEPSPGHSCGEKYRALVR